MGRSANFLAKVESFLEQSGMTPTAFGLAVAKDPSFVHDLRRGRRPNLDTVEHVQKFMKKAKSRREATEAEG